MGIVVFKDTRYLFQGLSVPSDELICASSLLKIGIHCGSCDFLLHRRLRLRWLLAGATALRGVHLFWDRAVTAPLRNL